MENRPGSCSLNQAAAVRFSGGEILEARIKLKKEWCDAFSAANLTENPVIFFFPQIT